MRNLLLIIVAFATLQLSAQDNAYKITETLNLEATETKDQCRTGTCWSYSTVSFLESELIRMGKGNYDLSEMFNVRVTYPKKAEMYVRYHGKHQFGPGSLCHDVIKAMETHGVVPEEAYSGINYGAERHDHGQMDEVLKGIVEAAVDKPSTATGMKWMEAVESTLDAYLGEYPATFTYEDKEYTPASFRDMLGLNADDYVSLTSFTHHELYEPFVLEVPDNFSHGMFYNVELDELQQTVVNALENGYTVAWDADVSEPGFSFRNGMAIIAPEGVARDQIFTEVREEPNVDEEMRQQGFNNMQTTDDHLMHITGMAKDQNGNLYFIVKNSWGTGNEQNGYQYVSMPYFRMKTVSILLHKDGIPKALRKKIER